MLSTSHVMTACASSTCVLMSGGPTGLTLMPTTSPGSKKRAKLSFMSLPVSVRMPRSNISATTFASILSSTSDARVLDLDHPARETAPGSACLPFGHLHEVGDVGLGRRRGVRSCAPGTDGTPSTMPPAAAEAAPILTNSRRVTSVDVGIGW